MFFVSENISEMINKKSLIDAEESHDLVTISIKRAYEPAIESNGSRILVDRLWPRGLSKDKAKISKWLPEIAPSNELRKWFNHEVDKWPGFVNFYLKELEVPERKRALFRLKKLASKTGVTLLYAAKDEKRNNAVVLLRVLATEA